MPGARNHTPRGWSVRSAARPCIGGGEALLWDPLAGPLPHDLGKIDCLIGYAGITPGAGADLRVNATLAEATLSAAHQAGIGRVLLTSSSAVYGLPVAGAPLSEDVDMRPLNDYGRSKVEMEAVCEAWRARGMQICCLRIGNVAGADAVLANPAAGGPIAIDRFADGAGPLSSYIGPVTLAQITAALAGSLTPLPPVLNIAAPKPVAMADLAQAAGFTWHWQEAPATAHQRITLDLSRLAGIFPFTATDSDPGEMIAQWQLVRDPA